MRQERRYHVIISKIQNEEGTKYNPNTVGLYPIEVCKNTKNGSIVGKHLNAGV